MDRGVVGRHVLYYAPGCAYCKDFLQRIRSSRVMDDFNAFDVSVSPPPPQVTHVPTIFVMGEYLKGAAAFQWLDRVSGGGTNKETPGVVPGQKPETDELMPVESDGLSYASLPNPGQPTESAGVDLRGSMSRSSDDTESFDDKFERYRKERESALTNVMASNPLPGPPVA